MKALLDNNNQDLLREVEIIKKIVSQSITPNELDPYKNWIITYLKNVETAIDDNFYYLSLNQEKLYEDVLKKTQIITMNLRLIGSRFTSPIFRYKTSDKLCLKLLDWLHNQHTQTQNVPFGISDGGFSVYPYVGLPILYFLPNSSQFGLLHLPLFFHEFGHYLYVHHKKEMNDLADALQIELDDLLTASFQQNDAKYNKDRKDANYIIETWLIWIQEIFCDSVGLVIGGASYLYAFSHYLRMAGKGCVYRPVEDLIYSSHPVSWIRIKLLADRAKKMGLNEEAEAILSEWSHIADAMNERGNFHAYYLDSYKLIIQRTIDDMLIEADPIQYKDYLTIERDAPFSNNNFIELLNYAWVLFLKNPSEYYKWEDAIVSSYSANHSN
jgi:hypothetical protein